MRANQRMDERVTQYFRLNFRLFWTTVRGLFAHFLIFLLVCSFARALAPLFAHLPAHLLICPLISCLFARFIAHSLTCLLDHSFADPFSTSRLFLDAFSQLYKGVPSVFICPSVRPSVNISDHPSICLSVCLFIHYTMVENSEEHRCK